jgi:hypothetical protein
MLWFAGFPGDECRIVGAVGVSNVEEIDGLRGHQAAARRDARGGGIRPLGDRPIHGRTGVLKALPRGRGYD